MRVQGFGLLGLRAWCLVFGVWFLVFGVWGSGFGVRFEPHRPSVPALLPVEGPVASHAVPRHMICVRIFVGYLLGICLDIC